MMVSAFGTAFVALALIGCAGDNSSSPGTEVLTTEPAAAPDSDHGGCLAGDEFGLSDETPEPECLGETLSQVERSETASPPLRMVFEHPEFDCLNQAFDMFVDVFGVYVVGTSGVPDAHLLHTANVLAQYLDNDEDGVPDDSDVLGVLTDHNFVVPVWMESDRDSFRDGARGTPCEDDVSMAASMYYGQDQWAFGGLQAAGSWDTNLEEVWHVVSVGWYETYPEFFGDEPESRLSKAMDTARGGHFEHIPDSYPEGSWYAYDDDTCDYRCQIHEYFYWLLMANIGALDPSISDKCDDSRHEWHVCSKSELEQVDELAYALLNHYDFSLPTRIPTGTYLPLD